MIGAVLSRTLEELGSLLPKLSALSAPLQQLGEAMAACWQGGGKILIAGNGGSAADAMHFAEELVVRFRRNRRALAAMALCDPAVLTCAGNDLGYESVFARQIEALGNAGDVFIAMSTSGNSANVIRAVELARQLGLRTAGFLGKGGGKCLGLCEIELVVPCETAARVQEAHHVLFHTLCEWIEQWLLSCGPGEWGGGDRQSARCVE
jgi:D-sedoheptulose 7-phosphate isomerase